MAGLAKENFQEEFEVDQIRQNKKLSPKLRQSMIEETRKSFFNKKKNSSWSTILNISNNMIGSSVLIFPLVFMKFGFINATAILLIMGIISCETCILQIRHVKLNELDLPESINRILGKKWFYAYVFSSFIFNMFSVAIYFILMTSLLYSILEYFFVIGWDTPLIEPTGEGGRDMVFERFSKEWTQIAMALLMILLYSIPYLKFLLIICQYGILGIFFYVFYLFTKAGINISEGNVVSQSIRYVSPDISTLAGIFSLAFFVHNNMVTIVKSNKHPEKNTRDVMISFILTGALYLSIGIFGGLAIAGNNEFTKTPHTVLEYFGDSIWVIIIDIFIFLQLLSVSPLCWYIGRTQLLQLKYQNNPSPKILVFLLNVLFVGLCLILNLLKIEVTLIISLNGAVCGYLMLYLIPIKLHLNCLYESHEGEIVYNGQLLMKNYDLSCFAPDSPQRKWQNELRERELIEDLRMSKLALEFERNDCKSAHLTLIKGHSKLHRYLFYGVISLFGLAIGIWEIVLICTGNS